MNVQELKLSVQNHWLLLFAGVVWSAAGAMLCFLAYGWWQTVPWMAIGPLAATGVALALAIYRFGFSKLALKNIRRIGLMAGDVCPLAFQTGKSYATTVLMMGLGIVLKSSPIPKPDLAVLYLGIGGALILASIHYYRRLIGL